MPSDAAAAGLAAAPALPAPAESLSISPALAKELCRQADIVRTGLSEEEFVGALSEIGRRHNFNLSSAAAAGPAQREAFFRSLHLRDLSLAQACARGYEAAWNVFLRDFRTPMQRAATAIAHSASAGEELADSLYAELFGLSARQGVRSSPFAGYSGRGPLLGWLRATLAQRHIDQYRRTHREDPLEGDEYPATAAPSPPEPQLLAQLTMALRVVFLALAAEDRFVLSSYFLDGHTLLDLARVLRVHEATMSRRINKLTKNLHKKLLKQLEAAGMSRRAAQEALSTDPRDLTLNLRNLLQSCQASPFSDQGADTGKEQA